MSTTFLCKLSLCILFLSVTVQSYGQYDTDSLDLGQDVSVWYDQQLGIDKTQLVLGTYQKIQLSINSHPFFMEKHWIRGNIEYRGEKFLGVNMRYDTYQDFVIINHPTNLSIANQPIRLFSDEIDSFELNGHLFLNLKGLEDKKGIYEVLFNGSKLLFISKRIKTFGLNSNALNSEYKSEDKYYMMINNQLTVIRNKRSYILLFPKLKKDIRKYTKSKGLFPNIDNERDMILVAEFCESRII